MSSKRVLLSERDMPAAWYNLLADLPEPLPPPLNPGTGKPLGPGRPGADLLSVDHPARDVPRPLGGDSRRRAPRVRDLAAHAPGPRTSLERELKTPANLLQGRKPQPSRQPQAQHGCRPGLLQQDRRRHAPGDRDRGRPVGSSLAFACKLFGLDCKVYMVKVSYQQKPYRRSMMHMWGGRVTPSPSDETDAGRQILAAGPQLPGQPRHRHQRSRRGGRQAGRRQVRPGQRAQPRHAPSDHHRPGSREATEDRRRQRRRDHRLRGRRKQFRRPGLPLPAAQVGGQGHPLRGRRAQVVPDDEPRRISLRFRRHHQAHAADQDVYPRTRLHPAGHPRRRAAIPRNVAAGQPGRSSG